MDTYPSKRDPWSIFEEDYNEDPPTEAVETDLLNRWQREYDWDFVALRIAVGGVRYTEKEIHAISDAGFTDVFNCRIELERQEEKITRALNGIGVTHHFVGTADNGDPKVGWFMDTLPVLTPVLRRPKSRVLIHCAAGYSRAPSLTYAALRIMGDTPLGAYTAIKRQRLVGMCYALEAEIVFQEMKRDGRI